jgi:hypothetical protein
LPGGVSWLRSFRGGLLFGRGFIVLRGWIRSGLGARGLCVVNGLCGGLRFGLRLFFRLRRFRGLFVLSRLRFFLLSGLGLLFVLLGFCFLVLRGLGFFGTILREGRDGGAEDHEKRCGADVAKCCHE